MVNRQGHPKAEGSGTQPRDIDMEGRAKCTKCQQWKFLDKFYKDKRRSLGIRARCKDCTRADRPPYDGKQIAYARWK